MRVLTIVSLSAIAASIFPSTAKAQEATFSYGGVQITGAPTEVQPILPRRPNSYSLQPIQTQNPNLQIIPESQNGFGEANEYRLNYRLNLSPRFSTNIQSPLIQETPNTRHGVEISGSPRLGFSWLLGTTDSNQLMSNQREGVNYNPFSDPNIDQSALTIFDRQKAKWQSEPAGQLYGMNRY
jgi:hypothetical protein